ncbi:DNA replication licensing factor, mcm4 component [Brettanomyces nanus]|uniref:DNA replication licensing factor MCM4 n=1 Tax=Eeniella nana TaxID=13502 RepID=A0A875RZZ0_EENNA|nr:DNA replication licensing factor, mcm4 component [Brettanomyces nanus]QPG73625.1 DNA replication licensing factor, mcm4 component [Brettanomyces nanus]
MSSPVPSSPPDDTNDTTTPNDTLSQTQRPNAVPSSPLFMPPSSDSGAPPSSQVGSGEVLNHPEAGPSAPISSSLGVSSPLAHGTSELFASSSSRPATSADEGTRRRHQSRGDIHSSDFFSSPMKRRFFTENNSSPRKGDLSSSSLPSSAPPSSLPGSDIGNLTSNTLQPHVSSSGTATSTSHAPDEPVRVIWGTNVSIQECSDNFRTFLMSFKLKYRKLMDNLVEAPTEDDKLYYVDMLNMMKETGSTNLNLDCRNLLAYPSTKKLYYQLINYPQEVVPIMDQTIKDCLVSFVLDAAPAEMPGASTTANKDALVDQIESNVYKVRPHNIENHKGMRELNPGDIDKLVSVKGLVIRATPIIPDMKVAFFKCNVCDHTVVVENDRGLIQEPTKCPRPICGATNSMQLIHNRSSFANKQVIKLQETPDLVPDGQTPHSVSLCVYDELVDTCRAGDRVDVCGIFKSSPVKVNPRQRALRTLYKTYVDVVHIKKTDARRLSPDNTTLENELKEQQEVNETRQISEKEIKKIKQVSERDDLYELLARSLAPSIYEMDDVKKGILLQLFGGNNRESEKLGRTRGDINILLCGDPSTSKSQLLQYVHKIAPRGIYTSGKGSSAVGLTAYITRDVDTHQLVLESGALVLSDGGVCCIDEFDKMSDSTRSVLHEVMEQQTISIAKAGIITTLNARASILASANPIDSRYNPNLPVTKNIDLPPTLLSRFDLVYLILDKVDEKIDGQLARHIAGMYLEDTLASATKSELLSADFLTAYIQYAKEQYKPILNEEAKNELVRSYVEMRKLGEDARSAEKRITATTRQLESLIRLSEAHSKMRLSETVELSDVQEAVRLMRSALKDYATDPLTGRIDMDLVQTGQTSADRKMKEDLTHQVAEIISSEGSINYNTLLNKINEQSSSNVENYDLGESIKRLEADGQVVTFGKGHRREIRANRSGLV